MWRRHTSVNLHRLSKFRFSTVKVDRDIVISVDDDATRPELKFNFGKLARLSDGSCVCSLGSTAVLVTAVCNPSKMPSGFQGFVPLTVDYRQKCAAAGRIPTNFLRRELGPSDKEILTGRVIDRSLRPLFPKGFDDEVQIMCNLLAVDGTHDPEVLAINGASAALAVSHIPWNGPVGAVRVAKLPGHTDFLINPTRKELANSELNLMVTGTEDRLTVMLEAEARNVDRYLFLDGIRRGLDGCARIASSLNKGLCQVRNESRATEVQVSDELYDAMRRLCDDPLRRIFNDTQLDKTARGDAMFAVRDAAVSQLKLTHPKIDVASSYVFNQVCKDLMAQTCFDTKLRVDGRSTDQLRPISCQVALYEPLHGSALFQRGQTQVMCTVTLDSLESSLKSDTVSLLTSGIKEKNFFLHYEFPPYATNEIGKVSSANRRERGHGALAEKALKAVIPANFPFTIRLTSEVLESNGSSSMASVCGGSLALLDAGVPISSPTAGVAVGLMSRPTSDGSPEYQVLLDILGLEDFLGEMDFKMAGTQSGITALQADIKLPGVPFQVICDATHLGHSGILQILGIMNQCLNEPRLSRDNWPVSETLTVPLNKRAKFVGPGGMNLKRLTAEMGVQLTPDPDKTSEWRLFAPNKEALAEAKDFINANLTTSRIPEFEFGSVITVEIVEIQDRGVLVQLHPEMEPVLIPNSQLEARKILNANVLGLKVGDSIQVKYFGCDPVTGMIRLSRKVLQMGAAQVMGNMKRSFDRK